MATEEERRRLRRELHDGLGPALAGVALGVDAARNILRSDPQAADALLEDLKHETLDTVAEVRRIVDDLRPGAVNERGLLPALSAFVERVSSRETRLRVVLHAPARSRRCRPQSKPRRTGSRSRRSPTSPDMPTPAPA